MPTIRFIAPVLLLCLLTFAVDPRSANAAETFRGGAMTITLPDGWKAAYKAEDNQLMVYPGTGDAAVMISLFDSGGHPNIVLATILSEEFNGTAPEQPPGGENHYFTAPVGGAEGIFSVISDTRKCLVFAEIGNIETYAQQVDMIWNSLRSSDPLEQALLSTLSKY